MGTGGGGPLSCCQPHAGAGQAFARQLPKAEGCHGRSDAVPQCCQAESLRKRVPWMIMSEAKESSNLCACG
eukprot:10907385-Prorocentrum_lima.AAC.1